MVLLIDWTRSVSRKDLSFVMNTRLASLPLVFLLAVLASSPALANDNHYRFIIIGDRTGGIVPGVYEGILEEVELLQPDFCVDVGDHIEGYTTDTGKIRTQWTEFFDIEKVLSMPIYRVAGNHDIWSATSEALYEELVGKTRYTFDIQDTHFIVLNSSTNGEGPMPDEPYEWLKAHLESRRESGSESRLTFLFFHHPAWWYDEHRGAAMPRLQALCEEHGVDAVFTGHWHRYLKASSRVNYYVIGSSGGTIGGAENFDTGAFFHYAHVAVSGDSYKVALIKRGSVLPDTFITWEFQEVKRRIEERWATVEPLALDFGATSGAFKVVVHNPFDEELSGQLNWKTQATAWDIQPVVADYRIPPRSDQEFQFRATGQGGRMAALPELVTEYASRELGRTLYLKKFLVVTLKGALPKLSSDIAIREPVREWPLPTKLFDIKGAMAESDLSATVSGGWSDAGLAFRVTVRDNVHSAPETGSDIWQNDCVQFAFDTEANGPLEGYGPRDYEFAFSLTDDGVRAYRHAGPGGPRAVEEGEVTCGIERNDTDGVTVYQVFFPWEALAPANPARGVLGLNVALQDNDGKGHRGGVELSPGTVYTKSPARFARFEFGDAQ